MVSEVVMESDVYSKVLASRVTMASVSESLVCKDAEAIE